MRETGYASFPKWLKESQLKSIDMPVLVLLGENELAFDIRKVRKKMCSAFGTRNCKGGVTSDSDK